MGEYKGYLVQPKDVHRIWDNVEPLIQLALDSIDENEKAHYLITSDFRAWFHEALTQLFIITKDKQLKLIAITEIGDHGGRHKLLHCMLIGGEGLSECYEELQRITEEFALREGCVRMVIHARKGMQKYLENLQWEEVKTKHKIIMMKNIGDWATNQY
tara:strand:+ start:200 stop:673 length:474 start_codon:yes stop_codon:yes gene_type:complete